jgi:hypothetical protein
MDNTIAAASTQMSQMQLQNQVQTAVLGKAMESEEAQGEAMVEMIRSSAAPQQLAPMADPEKGQNVNILA